MRYARLYADQDGESHFEDVDVDVALADFAPPAPPVGLSEMTPAQHVGFLSLPRGWEGGYHVAPSPMLLFVIAGEVEFVASDGGTRRFWNGSVLAVEDTSGKGHAVRVVSDDEVQLAFAGLAD